jgi:hypothetical protein
MGEAWEPSKKQYYFGNRGAFDIIIIIIIIIIFINCSWVDTGWQYDIDYY